MESWDIMLAYLPYSISRKTAHESLDHDKLTAGENGAMIALLLVSFYTWLHGQELYSTGQYQICFRALATALSHFRGQSACSVRER